MHVDYAVQHHFQIASECWSVAATMVLGVPMTVGLGRATLGPKGGLDTKPENIRLFAQDWGLREALPRSKRWTIDEVYDLLCKHGALYIGGSVPHGHAYVLAGMWGEGSEENTTLKVYDPHPIFGLYERTWAEMKADWPDFMYLILHRR